MFYENDARYAELLPHLLRGVAQIKALDDAIKPQLEGLNAVIKTEVDNKSVAHSNLNGVKRWEQILALSTPIGASLQARKDAVKAKLMSKPPINLQTLRRVVETYLGVPVDIEMWWSEDERSWGQLYTDFANWGEVAKKTWGDYHCTSEPFVIWIYYKGTNGIVDITPLYATIYDMIPANLIVHINYRYDNWGQVLDKYGTWGKVAEKTWNNIRLGG